LPDNMSQGIGKVSDKDVSKMLVAQTHIGSRNLDPSMERYVFKRRPDGVHVLNLQKTWEKINLAARVIVAIENPADVCIVSSAPYAQRGLLKFAKYTGATPIAGRYTPGTFTNQSQNSFSEPRLLIVTDPRVDHLALKDSSYMNVPTIAFCNTDSPLNYVDIAVPCNNVGANSLGLMLWMLCREVLFLRNRPGSSRPTGWDVMPDLFFYRDVEEQEKDETRKRANQGNEGNDNQTSAPEGANDFQVGQWEADQPSDVPTGKKQNWNSEVIPSWTPQG